MNLNDGVKLHGPVGMDWSAEGVGFGQFYFYEKDGVIQCDNECMSKEFIKRILCTMVDQCVLSHN